MPYAPGVQDISGQLRAQGIAQAGNAWAQAIGNISKDIGDAFQTYKQNQFITNQAMGQIAGYTKANKEVLNYLEGAASDEPNTPTLAPEVLQSWAKVKEGKPTMRDAATVKAFLEAYDTNKKTQLQNQMMQLKVDEARRAADFWKSVNQPEGAAEAPASAAALASGPLAGMTGPAATVAQQAPAPQQAAVPSGVPAMLARPTGAVTPQDFRSAAMSLRGMPGITAAQLAMTARQAAGQRVKEFESTATYQGPDAQKRAETDARRLDETNPLPNRLIRVPKYSDSAKGYVFDIQQRPQTAQEKADEAAATEEAVASTKDANTFLSNLQNRGTEAANSLAHNLEIKKFLRSGVETGPLEGAKAEAIAIASKFGLASKDAIDKANDFNKVRALMMEDQIRFAAESTKGNLNTYEQKMMAKAKANAEDKLAGSNEYLNDLVIAAKMKEADSIAEERRVRNQFPDKKARAQYLKDWSNDPQNSLFTYMNKIGANATQPQASSGAPTPTPTMSSKAFPVINSQAEYDALPAGAKYIDSKGNTATKKGK